MFGNKSYRIFTTCLGWSEVIFVFEEKTKFSEIRNHLPTSMLKKDDYVGPQEFSKGTLKALFNVSDIGKRKYYYRFMHHKDDATREEQEWKMIPKYEEKEVKQKEYRSVDVDNNKQSSAADFNSLFGPN